MKSYYLEEHAIDLDALQERLRSTDLIPSQKPLLDGMAEKARSISKTGVTSLAELRSALKTEQSLTLLSRKSGVDANYLQLLRRVINGFFPKPRPLKDIVWLEADTVNNLNKAGMKNTRQLFDAASGGAAELIKQTGIGQKDAQELLSISDLCRIQWVSPTFARVLVAAGFRTATAIAGANPEALFQAITKANRDAKFYKGAVGLRDIKRLVTAARYVP